MKNLFLAIALLLAAIPAIAQTTRTAARPDSQVVAQAAPDTAAAIHRLFAARRKRRNVIAYIAAGAAVGGTIAASAGTDHFLNRGEYAKLYGLMAAAIIALDFLASDSSKKYEQELVDAFNAHQLPFYIRKKLKPKYFQQAKTHSK